MTDNMTIVFNFALKTSEHPRVRQLVAENKLTFAEELLITRMEGVVTGYVEGDAPLLDFTTRRACKMLNNANGPVAKMAIRKSAHDVIDLLSSEESPDLHV